MKTIEKARKVLAILEPKQHGMTVIVDGTQVVKSFFNHSAHNILIHEKPPTGETPKIDRDATFKAEYNKLKNN